MTIATISCEANMKQPNYDTQNYPYSLPLGVEILNTKVNKPTNQNSIKVPKVAKATYKKTLI